MMKLLVTAAAGAYVTLPVWGRAAVAAGVPIPVHVTATQTAAMGAVSSVLGTTPQSNLARQSAFQRLLDIRAQLLTTHARIRVPGTVPGLSIELPVLSRDEQLTVVDAFIAAADVAKGGAASAAPNIRFMWAYARARALRQRLLPYSTGSAAVDVWLDDGRAEPAEPGEWNSVLVRLAVEIDDLGYLITGAPPPEPTIAGGVGAAAGAVAEFVAGAGAKVGGVAAGVAGDAVGSLANALVGSPVVWAAALGFVAWKVMR